MPTTATTSLTAVTPFGAVVQTFPLNNAELPGYRSPDVGGTDRRVFNPDGAYIGTIRYTSRRRHDARIGTVTEWGWRTDASRKLTTSTDAVRSLIAAQAAR